MELEEAIIFLMKMAKEYKTYGDLDNPEFEDIKKIPKAIETVLQALKDKDKEIKRLEEENMQKGLEIIGTEEYTKANMAEIIEQYYTANENCIPKQKIEDKIKEYEKLVEDFEKTDNSGRFKRTNSIDYYKLEVLQELLEDK